jgi:hypothetical protein
VLHLICIIPLSKYKFLRMQQHKYVMNLISYAIWITVTKERGDKNEKDGKEKIHVSFKEIRINYFPQQYMVLFLFNIVIYVFLL